MSFVGRVDLGDSSQRQRANDYPMVSENTTVTDHRFRDECLRSANIEVNEVNTLYFSKLNVDAIQMGMRTLVYNRSCGKVKIGNQSASELQTIMRGIYFENSTNQVGNTLEQVRSLNQKILDFAVPRIIQEAQMHGKYVQDMTSLPEPMARSFNDSVAGTKTLELKRF